MMCHLKRNISCDAHLLNELLETDVTWDDAIVVSAGKLRKLCAKNLAPTGIRSPDRPARSKSQYQQSYNLTESKIMFIS